MSNRKTIILMNSTNLHVGGGVTSAASLINSISKTNSFIIKVIVSSEVDEALQILNTEIQKFATYIIKDIYGIQGLFFNFKKEVGEFDLLYTIFGPRYFLKSNKVEIVGFAQPWIALVDQAPFYLLPWLRRVLFRTQLAMQRWFFAKSDYLVVEHAYLIRELRRLKAFRKKNFLVVENELDDVYFHPERWHKVPIPKRENVPILGLVSRNYLHKNIEVLADVRKLLREKYAFHLDFVVTFNDSEWFSCSQQTRSELTNLGPVTISQVPYVISNLDGIIFPSLLECFSATLLEALAFNRPIFSSDRIFVREILGNYPIYFDPINPQDMAAKIYSHYSTSTPSKRLMIESPIIYRNKRALKLINHLNSIVSRSNVSKNV